MILILVALVLTILIEVAVAVVLGYRKKLEIATVVLVNIITNTILNYFLYASEHFKIIVVNTVMITILEAIIILVEWQLLRFALRQDSKKLFILSFAMNISSYLIGGLIFGWY